MTPKAQYRQSQRMICILAGLDYPKVRRNEVTDRERRAYSLAAEVLGDGTLICDSSGDVAVQTSGKLDGSLEAYEWAWKQLEERFEAAMRKYETWPMGQRSFVKTRNKSSCRR